MRSPWGLLLLAACLGLLLGGGAAWDLVRRDAARRAAARSTPVTPAVAAAPGVSALVASTPVVEASLAVGPRDEGQLWQSPTSGAPLDLRGVPSGSQLIVAWRPAAMLSSEEGVRTWQALGPWSEYWQRVVRERTGLRPEETNSLVAAFSENLEGALSATLIVEAAHDIDLKSLRAAWGNPQPLEGHESAWSDAAYGYFVPNADEPRRFVVTPRERLEDLLAQGDDLPPLSRELEQLAETSDRDRWLTVLVAGGFLSRSGRAALVGELPHAWSDVEVLLSDETKAAAFSLHVDDRLFFELRSIGRSATRPRAMAEDLQARLNALPNAIGRRGGAVQTTPEGRELLAKLPDMLKVALAYTRVEVQGDQVVARAYLPAAAAHHLALAGQILLVDGAPGSAAPSAPSDETPPLERRVTLRAPRTTLEGALAELAEQIQTPISVAGSALQREGITRNQMFAVDLADVTAAAALDDLLRSANAEGKLTYVVTGAGADLRVEVTTRAALEFAAAKEPRP